MNDIQKYQSTEVLYTEQFGGELIEDSRQWLIDAERAYRWRDQLEVFKDTMEEKSRVVQLAQKEALKNKRQVQVIKTKEGWAMIY